MVDIFTYSHDSGIYGIYIDNALVYIGKTKNFRQRFSGHATSMRHSKAQWYPLAREFDKRGHIIEAKILECVPLVSLSEKEKEYIDNFQPMFNIDECPKYKTRPSNYDAAIEILGIAGKPPVIEE